MILDLVSTFLRIPAIKFDFTPPPVDPVDLAHDLCQTVIHNNGISLSANQCGLPWAVFVIKANPMIVAFNPIIVDVSEDEISLDEVDLSYPNLKIKIKRPEVVKVRFAQPNGEVTTVNFQGLTARAFQHSMDQVLGRTFQSRAHIIELERGKMIQKKTERSLKH